MANAKFADVCEGRVHGEDRNRTPTSSTVTGTVRPDFRKPRRTPPAAIRKRICRHLIHPILSKEKTCRRRTNKKPPQKQKNVTTWCASEKKGSGADPPHFSATPRFLPPPRLGAIAHACTQINQAHAGTLTHATTKHLLRGSRFAHPRT